MNFVIIVTCVLSLCDFVSSWYRQYEQNGFRYHVSSNSRSYHQPLKYSTNSTVVRYRPGRHICTQNTPAVRTVTTSCHGGKVCKSARVQNDISYMCCPGWTYVNSINHGCFQAVCSTSCLNGGSCTKPDICTCPRGFTGRFCEIDIDECTEQKPCDQSCTNTPGSFLCSCKDGFELLDDGRSCRSEGNTASEADDLNNDVEILTRKVLTLEEKLAHECVSMAHQSDGKINAILEKVATIKTQLHNYELQMEELHRKVNELQRSEPIIKRVLPLCSQVSTLRRQVNQCYCSGQYNSQYSHYSNTVYH